MPSTFAALRAAAASISLPIADIEAELVGAAAASASIAIQPPSLDLVAAIEGALQLPGVAIDITVMTKLVADLEAKIAALQVSLAAVLAIREGFSASGIHGWAIEDKVSAIGPSLTTALMGAPGFTPDNTGLAVVLAASSDPLAVQTLKTLFAL